MLRNIILALAALAFLTIGYNLAVNAPKLAPAQAAAASAKNDLEMFQLDMKRRWESRRGRFDLPSNPAEGAADASMEKDLWKRRNEADESATAVRHRRDLYSASATGLGVLAFLLSIVATRKKPKGLLVFGAIVAALSGIAWVGLTMAQDGHL